MNWRQHTPEDIVCKLGRVRTAMARGVTLVAAIASEHVSESTYFRWKALYGELTVEQLRRAKELEIENARLRRLLVELEYPTLARQA